jgi:hypothetical protein
VEGDSDRAALEAVAVRRGRDLAVEGVRIVPVGGATNVRRVLASAPLRGVRVSVLCDQAEEGIVRRAWERAGRTGAGASVFVCVADLEEELIRAAGPAAVLEVVAAQGEDRSFAALRQQPAHRGRPVEDVLRRFMGSRSGRKATYARLLVEALPLAAVPAPLDAALASVLPASGGRPADGTAIAAWRGDLTDLPTPRTGGSVGKS